MRLLGNNEIVATAHAVKYHHIEYHDDYVVVHQHRTRRRVYNGWFFEDTGAHLYVSEYYSGMFQHSMRTRQFIVNTVTKEWKDYKIVAVERHQPIRMQSLESNEITELEK